VYFIFQIIFPQTQIHPHARQAAQAAEAAAIQDEQFWSMHDTLFIHQQQLRTDLSCKYANDLGAA